MCNHPFNNNELMIILIPKTVNSEQTGANTRHPSLVHEDFSFIRQQYVILDSPLQLIDEMGWKLIIDLRSFITTCLLYSCPTNHSQRLRKVNHARFKRLGNL